MTYLLKIEGGEFQSCSSVYRQLRQLWTVIKLKASKIPNQLVKANLAKSKEHHVLIEVLMHVLIPQKGEG